MGNVLDLDKGWKRIISGLKDIADKEIAVGVQADARSEDGKTNLATIAAVHEFGTMIIQHPGTVTVYRKMKKNGEFARGGQFVKKSKSNFSSTHRSMGRVILIPERSFLRSTFDERQDDIAQHAQRAVAAVVAGGDYNECIQKTGAYVQGLVQQKIRNGPFEPNKPSTVKRKGSSRPLIDTGHLRQSIRYVVKPK